VNPIKTSQQMTQDLVTAQTLRASLLSQFWRLLAAARAIETQPGATLVLSTREYSETEFDVSAVGRSASFSMFHDRPDRHGTVIVADSSFHTPAPIELYRFTFGADGDTDVDSGPGDTPVALTAADDCQRIVLTALGAVLDHDPTTVPKPPRPADD
jgi:hypothetical protein